MDFLKAILGDDLYSQVEAKVNAYNADEANKDKQVKIGNLASGEYTSTNKYSDLETEKGNLQQRLQAAQQTIADLKKSNKGDEGLQQKVTEYEAEITKLTDELAATKTDNALRNALTEAGAVDVDYLMFKVKQKGKVEMGEDGKIKGIDDTISSLKTQYAQQFSGSGSGKKYDEKKLPEEDDQKKGITKKELLSMPYPERNKFYQKNPEKFNEIMNS